MAGKSDTASENRTEAHTGDDLSKLVADLRQEVQTLRGELADLAGAASSLAREELASLKQYTPESARDMLHKAEARVADLAEKTRKRAASAEETIEAQAAEHPWRTLGIVGLAGFALGLLIRR